MGNAPACGKSPRTNARAIFDESTNLPDEGYGPILYNATCEQPDGTFQLAEEKEFDNLVQMLEESAKRYSERQCSGWRNLIQIHKVEENGKMFDKLQFENAYTWWTYAQYEKKCFDFGSGLHAVCGLAPQSPILIYAETQRDWMVGFFGAASRNLTVVTAYATLGVEGVSYAITQTNCTACIVDNKLFPILAKALAGCPQIKYIFTIGNVDDKVKEEVVAQGVTVVSMEETISKGEDNPVQKIYPDRNDRVVVMYTSGTTANPKGVCLTHGNLLTGAAGIMEWFTTFGVKTNDIYLAFLPLAHIMELCAEINIIRLGIALGYGNPHTLTPTGLKLKVPESQGDAAVLKPTICLFAPAILDRIYQGVIRKVAASGGAAQWVFNQALESGKHRIAAGGHGAALLWDRLACKNIQDMLGGRLRITGGGSAPITAEVQMFIQTVLDAPFRQGYGLTETCAASVVQLANDTSTSCVGVPFSSQCIRLADWQEGGYTNADKHKPEIGMPRGEILIGGGVVCTGYYVNEENPDQDIVAKNNEDFIVLNGLRFFRTGDVGQVKKDGSLQIIDRKKDLWKGPQGEYVSFGKVEGALKLSKYTDVAMVYGKTGGEFPIVLVCPNEKLTKDLAQAKDIAETDFAKLCDNQTIVAEISKDLLAACKEARLQAFEIPKKVGLISELWTPENDMLTAAMKLKRPLIVKKHQADIDRLYA